MCGSAVTVQGHGLSSRAGWEWRRVLRNVHISSTEKTNDEQEAGEGKGREGGG